MTGTTVINDTIMTEDRGCKRSVYMTITTILIRWQMIDRGIFTHRTQQLTAVATITTRRNVRMHVAQECRRSKTGGGIMTDTAISLGRNMVCRLASTGYAIMAGCAVVDDSGMIESRACKGVKVSGAMTNRTIFCSRHMSIGLTSTDDTIMTGSTVIGDAVVVVETAAKGAWAVA